MPRFGEDRGWWSVDVPAELRDQPFDYGFCLDGGDPLPDPRTRCQPNGVHGLSRTFDPETAAWADHGFRAVPLAEAVIYELHVGTFTSEGTFAAAIERLRLVAELGATHIELMPLGAFAGRHGWGYDGVDLYAPHPTYGPPADLQRLVNAAHEAGLAVLLDVVYNHLGPEGNYLSQYGPYFTDRYHTPWGDAVNLDGPDSDEVRRFFVDNATMWLRDFHIDGLRLDAMHAAVDTSPVHILEQLRLAADAVADADGRPRVLIAEYEGNDPRIVRPLAAGGLGLDGHWNDDVHHALHTGLTGENTSYYEDYDGFADLVRCLGHGYAFAGRWSPHRRRTIGREPIGVGGNQLVACLQNHDQVGNRARGDRIGSMAGPARQKIGAALLFTGPFVPLLFQGEEWAASTPFPYFADHEDDLAEAVRTGRLREFATFGWKPEDVADPEDDATFVSAKLHWDERSAGPHADMLAWYRELTALRRDHSDLRDPALVDGNATWDPDTGVLVVERGRFVIAASLASQVQTVKLPAPEFAERAVLLASDPAAAFTAESLTLPPDSVAVLGPTESRKSVRRWLPGNHLRTQNG